MNYKRIGKGGTKVEAKKAAGIFFSDGKSVLLLKRAGDDTNAGTWGLPGGKGKEGESEIMNATREAREETGLDQIPGSRVDSVVNTNGHQKFTAFIYRVSKPFEVSLSDEHSAYEWVSFKKLDKTDLHPKLKENINRYVTAVERRYGRFSEWMKGTEV